MNASWKLRWRAFSLPKEGHTAEEYEDAFAGNPKTGRFAVADGAAESSFAGLWAKLLVEGFVASGEGRTTVGWLKPLQKRWATEVDPLALDWFGEEKREAGAFATFLGLSLRKPQGGNEGRWKAVAVGDSCIFQLRDDRLLGAFPVSRSADFGIRPALLGSRALAGDQVEPWSLAQQKIGRWQPGDRFFLTTDAVAQWFLRQEEERRQPWQAFLQRLNATPGNNALTAYFRELRGGDGLRNDDLTILIIYL